MSERPSISERNPEHVIMAGDWHGELSGARAALVMAAEAGVSTLVQLGDFGIWPGAAGRSYLDSLQRLLAREDRVLYFVDGNHEDFDQLLAYPVLPDGTREVRPNILHLPRGLRWTWQGTSFLALGGAVSVDRQSRLPMVSWWEQEQITAIDAVHCIDGGHADVMLCHDSPAGTPNPVVDAGDGHLFFPAAELRAAERHREMLRAVVEEVQPRFLFHGHYHVTVRVAATMPYGPLSVIGLDMNRAGPEENLLLVRLSDLHA